MYVLEYYSSSSENKKSTAVLYPDAHNCFSKPLFQLFMSSLNFS